MTDKYASIIFLYEIRIFLKQTYINKLNTKPMIKKILLLSVVISQLAISCSSDDSNSDSNKEQTLDEQIAAIEKLPYSALTETEQKTKLEAEANETLVQLDQMHTAPAIDATDNLENLLTNYPIEILNGGNDDQIEEILNVSEAYGIYTWNSAQKAWDITPSATELKFVFPAKENQLTNNASFTANSISSGILIDNGDETQTELPSKVDATLTIDGQPAATFSTNAKYANGGETVDAAGYKMVANGYTFEMNANRVPATANSSFSFEGKNIIGFNTGSTANIDELIKDDSALNQYLGSANGLITIMDNFSIIANTDNVGLANDIDALKASLTEPQYGSQTYDADLSNYNKSYSEGLTAAYNKNSKLIFVSQKDGTKIADVIQKSVKLDSAYSVDKYEEVLFLKFSDKTEVAMSTYFSTGFDNLNTKFQDFVTGFQQN